MGDTLGPHRRPTVRMQCELAFGDGLLLATLRDQALSEQRALALRHHPSDDVPAEDVQDDVEVKVAPLDGSLQLGDVPGPDLIRCSGQEFGLGVV